MSKTSEPWVKILNHWFLRNFKVSEEIWEKIIMILMYHSLQSKILNFATAHMRIIKFRDWFQNQTESRDLQSPGSC